MKYIMIEIIKMVDRSFKNTIFNFRLINIITIAKKNKPSENKVYNKKQYPKWYQNNNTHNSI